MGAGRDGANAMAARTMERWHVVYGAMEIVRDAHRGGWSVALREPAWAHPVRVGMLMVEAEARPVAVAAAMLHDALAAGDARPRAVERALGADALRRTEAVQCGSRLGGADDDARALERAEASDLEVKAVVCADAMDTLAALGRAWEHAPDGEMERAAGASVEAMRTYHEALSEVVGGCGARTWSAYRRVIRQVLGGSGG